MNTHLSRRIVFMTGVFCLDLFSAFAPGVWAQGQSDRQDQSTNKDEARAESSGEPTMPELREKLLAAVEVDQEARRKLIEQMQQNAKDGKPGQPDHETMQAVTKIDEENRTWLAGIVEESGWLGKTKVGTDGAHAAWLLVQHADLDLAFQKKCLALMKAEPEGEVAGKDIAYLTDRVLCAENKPQLYGTQLSQVDGKMIPRPIEDEENVDERRASVGLQPLAEYIKMATQAYLGSQKDADKADDAKSDDDTSAAGKKSDGGEQS